MGRKILNHKSEQINQRAGYAVIIGKPNVGKSTLLNSLLGRKLSIVTDKAQTTRKRIVGIYTSDEVQIIFFDTPGLINPRYELQRYMMASAYRSINESDVILVIFDINEHYKKELVLNKELRELITSKRKAAICVLNKSDLIEDENEIEKIAKKFFEIGIFTNIIPVSALMQTNIDKLIEAIANYLPHSAFLYDNEMLSTQPERFFIAELIREQVFILFNQEVPYSTEVIITDFKERESGKWYISADIMVEKSSQKGIIIGKKGAKLKELGEKSRILIEEELQKEVYLELFVKWRKNWRNNKTMLKYLGY